VLFYLYTIKGVQMTFTDWVNKTFGENGGARAAKHLGISYRTFRSYYACERFPRPTNCQVIVLKSNNKINVELWQQDYTNTQAKNKKVNA
jgi:hypothetical protein